MSVSFLEDKSNTTFSLGIPSFVSVFLSPLQLWCLELFLLVNSLGTKWQLQVKLFVVLQKAHIDAG